jgi:hypothetical protein
MSARDLNYDREHIHNLPEISRRLHQVPGARVLFLGNSLTRHGVSVDKVREELAYRGVEPAIERTVPVGTDVTDWIYAYKRFFGNVDQAPDIVIVGFVRHHVRDLKPPKRLRRLGRHFLDLQDAPECFALDLHRFDTCAEVLLSRYWASYGDQLLYREGALYAILPGFQASERRFNHILERNQERTAALKNNGKPPEHTFDRIRRLAGLLKETGAHGIFVAMPLPHIWEPDPQVRQAVTSMGMTYVDARKLEGITSEDFPDGYHMGEKAKTAYSRLIAKHLADRLKGLQPKSTPPATSRPGAP